MLTHREPERLYSETQRVLQGPSTGPHSGGSLLPGSLAGFYRKPGKQDWERKWVSTEVETRPGGVQGTEC